MITELRRTDTLIYLHAVGNPAIQQCIAAGAVQVAEYFYTDVAQGDYRIALAKGLELLKQGAKV